MPAVDSLVKLDHHPPDCFRCVLRIVGLLPFGARLHLPGRRPPHWRRFAPRHWRCRWRRRRRARCARFSQPFARRPPDPPAPGGVGAGEGANEGANEGRMRGLGSFGTCRRKGLGMNSSMPVSLALVAHSGPVRVCVRASVCVCVRVCVCVCAWRGGGESWTRGRVVGARGRQHLCWPTCR